MAVGVYSRDMARQRISAGAQLTGLILSMLIGHAGAGAAEFRIFRKTYVATSERTVSMAETFVAPNARMPWILRVVNGGARDRAPMANATVSVNGREVIGPRWFRPEFGVLESRLRLRRANSLAVRWASRSGSRMTVEIVGQDTTPPRALWVNPVPNQWTNAPTVLAKLRVTDDRSGVDAGGVQVLADGVAVTSLLTPLREATLDGMMEATLALSEGPHTLVARITDVAGLATEASVHVSVDRTAPTVRATVEPPPNRNGWHHTVVRIVADCEDELSGVAYCDEPVTMADDGEGQTRGRRAVDRAGNEGKTFVTVDIDRTAPTVRIAAPANGAIVAHPRLTVTGTMADALSGIVGVTCNGTEAVVTEATFQCDVPLVEGSQSMVVDAHDRAGNVAVASVQVLFRREEPMAVERREPASAAPLGVLGEAAR